MALQRFHANKAIFVDLDIRQHFHFPKLHSLNHYLNSIKLFGTTDNYDTQHTEQLHIDFAKDAYCATNHKDEYPQMTLWLERREKILWHEAYIAWRLRQDSPSTCSTPQPALSPVSPPAPPAPESLTVPLSPTDPDQDYEMADCQSPPLYLCGGQLQCQVSPGCPRLLHRQIPRPEANAPAGQACSS